MLYGVEQCALGKYHGRTLKLNDSQRVRGAPEWPSDNPYPNSFSNQIPLPSWGTLDSSCSHREFAAGVAATAILSAILSFCPDAVLGVDWHALRPYQAMKAAWEATHAAALRDAPGCRAPPLVYMNYRLHGRTDPACQALEVEALGASALSLLLCRADRRAALDMLGTSDGLRPGPDLRVLLPPLRSDLAGIGAPAAAALAPRRTFLTCAVRVAPEKAPDRFVELVEELARRGALGNLTPLICGSGWGGAWGTSLAARLLAAAPQAVVHTRFLGPAGLAEIFAATLLNVHPCEHDAYGMTIVEAASQGGGREEGLSGVWKCWRCGCHGARGAAAAQVPLDITPHLWP